MRQKTRLIVIGLGFFILLAFVVPYLVMQKVPSREELQLMIEEWGNWGFTLYTLLATLCTVAPPLNYTILGLAGGYVYGTFPAFLMLWIARCAGNCINFYLGRRYGRKVLKVFVAEENLHKYDELLASEKAALLYFVLCFLPGFPGDYAAYFVGFSKIKKRVFFLVTLIANIGCTFSLAYMGSGEAFTNPLFLGGFSIVFIGGLLWIHSQKKQFNLH